MVHLILIILIKLVSLPACSWNQIYHIIQVNISVINETSAPKRQKKNKQFILPYIRHAILFQHCRHFESCSVLTPLRTQRLLLC